MIQPSYDFSLFSIPSFSELFANELGAQTRFQANTPTPYVDFSINQFAEVLRTANYIPFQTRVYPEDNELFNLLRYFQSGTGQLPVPQRRDQDKIEVFPSGQLPEELNRIRRTVDEKAKKLGCSLMDLITGNCTPAILTESGSAEGIYGKTGDVMISDGKGTLGDDPTKSGEKAQSIADFFKALPIGSGYLLIGVIALILLLLFVKR